MDNKLRLKELKDRNKELSPIIAKKFKPFSGEFNEYRKNNIIIFEEYQANFEEIKALEWKLLTPEEQAKKLETKRKIIRKNA